MNTVRLCRAHWVPLAALAVLAVVSALLAVVVPSRTAAGYDRAAAAAAADTDLRVEGKAAGSAATSTIPSDAAMVAAATTWRTYLPSALRRATGDPEPSIGTARMTVGDAPRPQMLALSWDPGALARIRIVRGERGADAAPPGEIGVVVSTSYADATGRRPGDRLDLTEPYVLEPVRVRIIGLYAPMDAADPYWAPRPSMLRAQRVAIDRDGTQAELGTALMDPRGYAALTRDAGRQLTFSWRFPIRPGAVDADNAAEVAADVAAYRTTVQGLPGVFPGAVVTVLDVRLEEYQGRLRTAKSVLGLAFGGLAAAAAGVLLLAAGLLGERLRPVLGTMRARGASRLQLATPVCGLTAAVVLPSAGLGYAAGRLLDAGPPQAESLYAVAALALAVLPVPAVTSTGGLGVDRRDDLIAARPSRRRLVLDGLLVALAVIGVVLLRRRGAGAGTDPLIAAVPVLLGVALGALVLRAYPYLLRAAGPLLRRGRGVVAFVGLARASRQGLVGALPVAVLLLAAVVAGFTATVDTALRDGQERASWAEVGGDARVEAGRLDEAGLRRIRAVPGVTGVLPARIVENVTTATTTAPLTVIGVDLGAYRRLAPAVPGVPGSRVLMSPLAARSVGSGTVTLSRAGMDPIRVTPSGTIDRFPGQGADTAFVIVPYALLAGATGFPREVFVTGHDLDAGRLRAAAPGHGVVMRQDVLRDLADTPMVGGVHDTFLSGALIGGAFGLLAVLFVLIVGARARARTIAHLRALGLSHRQSRALALVEIAPVLLCATAAGWILGLLLPEITGPVVDLSPYTGGYAVTAHVPGLPALLGLLGALLLAAAAAVAVDRAFDAHPGTVLRTGD